MLPSSSLATYLRDRDPDAFRQLVNSHQMMVYAVCRRKLFSTEDVEDAVQEVFLKLARQADTIRSDLSAWLHTCAVHTSIDVIRRNEVRQRQIVYYAEVDGPSTKQLSDSSEILTEVDQALLQLDEADRSLIINYYLEGQTQQAISQTLGITPSGVQRRINRAVNRLRVSLDKRSVVATSAAIGATLDKDTASASVPTTLYTSLLKIGVAGVGPKTASSLLTSKMAIILLATSLVGVGLVGLIAALWRQPSVIPAAGALKSAPEATFTKFVVKTISGTTHYQMPFALKNNPGSFFNGYEEFNQSLHDDGFVARGPCILIYLEGIDDPLSGPIVFSVESEAKQDRVVTSRVATVPDYLCIAWTGRITDAEIPILVRDMTAWLKHTGYQRTGIDRYVFPDADGFLEIHIGIKRNQN